MAIMLVGNALSRSIFNRSWSFTEEIGQLLVVIVTLSEQAMRQGDR